MENIKGRENSIVTITFACGLWRCIEYYSVSFKLVHLEDIILSESSSLGHHQVTKWLKKKVLGHTYVQTCLQLWCLNKEGHTYVQKMFAIMVLK